MQLERNSNTNEEKSSKYESEIGSSARLSGNTQALSREALVSGKSFSNDAETRSHSSLNSLSLFEKGAIFAKDAATSMKDTAIEAVGGLHKMELVGGIHLNVPNAIETTAIGGAIGFASHLLLPRMGILGKLGNATLAASLTAPLLKEGFDAFNSLQSAKTENDLRLASRKVGALAGTLAATTPLGIAGFKAGTAGAEHLAFSARLKEVSNKLGVQELVESRPQEGDINLLNRRDLRKAPEVRTELRRNLEALSQADSYQPLTRSFGAYTLPVHNKEIAKLMRPAYTLPEFQSILDAHEKHHFWNLPTDQNTGFVRTSGAIENAPMVRQWVTDSIRLGDIQKVRDPENWKKSMFSLAKFYSQEAEIQAMRQTIRDPNFYREGPLENGVAHVFMPESLMRDATWYNNKRLESHGLALMSFSDTIAAGIAEPRATWGINRDFINTPAGQQLLQATKNLAEYILAVNTNPKTGTFDFKAPSAGNWEEMPFRGLTSDTEAMRAGLESYRGMLAAIEKFDNTGLYAAAKSKNDLNKIDEAIAVATELITRRVNHPDGPREHPSRPSDSSLAFISTSTIKFGDPITDAQTHFRILDALSKNLVRENGIIRYEPFAADQKTMIPDGYLGLNSWLLPSLKTRLANPGTEVKFTAGHSEDTSTPQSMMQRALQTSPEHVAQWPWVSTMADGYSRQVSKLLYSLDSGTTNPSLEVKSLINHGTTRATEYLNRSLARTTGIAKVKPNGFPAQTWVEPEAYEFIRTLNGEVKAVPGVNTPLAWAHASRHAAFRSYEKMLQQLEKQK